MAEPLGRCPFCGAPAQIVSGSTAKNGFFRLVICPECNITFPDEAAWNRRVPSPATAVMLEKIAATAEMFKTKRRGSGFGANISFTLDEMHDILAEWSVPTTPPAP